MLPEGNPYRGLRPFEAEHRALFFGRDQEIRAVLERLRSDPRVVVAGDSGVGKSSLCRAGVLPLVNDGGLGETSWRVVRLVPGRRPVEALAAALSPALEVNEEALGAWLASEPAALARALQRARQKTPGFGLLVFVDQAEELFTLAPSTEAVVVAEALGALGATAHARVLLAIRGDFVTRLASLPVLGEDLAFSLYLLRPMSADKLREVVVGPARARGFRYESDAMVERLVGSGLGSAGALPLLQFTLAELWETRDEERKVVPAAALDDVGGVEGALSRHADSVVAALQPEQREAVRRILLRLVTAEGTRARRTAAELEAHSGPAASALDALVAARLIVAREMEGEGTFELVHEALLTGWGTLRDLLDEAADERRLLQRLESAAGEWERLGCPVELLWRGRQLAEARQVDRELGPRESVFLERSADELRRQKAWRLLGIAAVPLLLLVVFLLAQLRTRHQLDEEVSKQAELAQLALKSGREIADRARTVAAQAFALYDAGPSRDGHASSSAWDRAERLWDQVRELRASARGRFNEAAQELDSALLLRPSRRDVRRMIAETAYAAISLDSAVDSRPPTDELLHRLRAHDLDGELLGGLLAPGTLAVRVNPSTARARLEVYRTQHGQLVPELVDEGEVERVTHRSLPAGSYRLVLSASGRMTVRFPFVLRPGETVEASLQLPTRSPELEDFIFVPAGRVLIGSSGPEDLRVALNAPPLHEVSTVAFWISRHEVTFADWIRMVEASPPSRQAELLPSSGKTDGTVGLQKVAGRWKLSLRPSSFEYRAWEGEPIRYAERRTNGEVDWKRLPVTGISPTQVERLLSYSRAAHGLRLCSELEWEVAARGADGRDFTTGARLDVGQANVDGTYGRQPGGFGPDPVGSHPESESPYGLFDVHGNAFELLRSWHDDLLYLEKGGSWYHERGFVGRLGARFALERETRSVNLGVRLCRDAGGSP
jgi:formylglycine-generating enzyme required for sulfatase activity